MLPYLKVLKYCCLIASVLSLTTNFYIFTYPSVRPEKCKWGCGEPEYKLWDTDLNLATKSILFTKNFVVDAIRQHILDSFKPSTSKEQPDKPSDILILALGDPQIKGSDPDTDYRTRIDTFGNDYFLGHIFTMMKRRLHPTHVAVMGDLFSSQWITDSEFYNRTGRYMDRIFKRSTKSIEKIKDLHHDEYGEYEVDWKTWGTKFIEMFNSDSPTKFDFGFSDIYTWDKENDDYLFINMTGNHDIGYSGDATYQHMARYNQFFGKDNYWIEYEKDTNHSWRIVVLNSMLLEGPALEEEFVEATWEFLRQLYERNFDGSTILLTHVPFYKEEGLCLDGPYFDYYPEDEEEEPEKKFMLRSQNHLSRNVSRKVLNLVFSNNKPGVILTGHDHEGCETVYNRKNSGRQWKASKTPLADYDYQITENTVKSMMGQYKGNAGLLAGRFNMELEQWEFFYNLCPFTNEHAWWVAKVSTIIAIFLWSMFVLLQNLI